MSLDLAALPPATAMATGDVIHLTRPSGPTALGATLDVLLLGYATTASVGTAVAAVSTEVAPLVASMPAVVADGSTDNLAVLQAFLTAAGASGHGVLCRLPPGRIVCSGVLTVTLTGNTALAIQGAGEDVTELVFTGASDGLVVTYSSNADYRRDAATGAKLQLSDLSIVRANAAVGNDGVRIVGDSQNASGINEPATIVSGVVFRGNSTNGGWANHLVYQDVANTTTRDIRMLAPNANLPLTSSGSGLVIRTSANRYGTLHFVENLAGVGLAKGLDIGERVQGVEVNGCNFIGDRGIAWNSVGRQEQLSVADSEFSCITAGIDVFNLQDVMVVSSVFYSQRAYPVGTGTPGAYTAINAAETDTVQLAGNTFTGSYLDGEFGIVITNDTSLVSTGRVTGGPHSVPMLPPGIVISGNTFSTFFGQVLMLQHNTSNVLVVGNSLDNIGAFPPVTLSSGTSAVFLSNTYAGVPYGVGLPGITGLIIDFSSANTINAALGHAYQRTSYTASGAINPADTQSLCNGSTALAMTLAAGTKDGHRILILCTGVAGVGVTGNFDAAANNTINLSPSGVGTVRDNLVAEWSGTDGTWWLIRPATAPAQTSGGAPSGNLLTSGATYQMVASDLVVVVRKTTGSATAITLPVSPTPFQIFTIKDGKGDAATNPITVSSSGPTIDGAATFVMNANYDGMGFVFDGNLWSAV